MLAKCVRRRRRLSCHPLSVPFSFNIHLVFLSSTLNALVFPFLSLIFELPKWPGLGFLSLLSLLLAFACCPCLRLLPLLSIIPAYPWMALIAGPVPCFCFSLYFLILG